MAGTVSGEGHSPDKSVRDDWREVADALGRAETLAYEHKAEWVAVMQSGREALARVEAELERLERLRDDLASDALDLRLMLKDNADLAEAEIERRDRELALLKGGLRRIADYGPKEYSFHSWYVPVQIARSLLASGLDTVQQTEGSEA